MKNNKFVIFLTILLITVYVLVWQMQPSQYGDTARFIPETAILYAEQKNVEDFLDDLENSRLGKAIQEIDFITIGKDIQLTPGTLALLYKINSLLKDNWDNEIIRELLGQKFTFALLQPIHNIVNQSPADFLQDNTVFLIQPKHKAELLQVIAEHYANSRENIEITTHQYGKHYIKRVVVDGQLLSTVAIDGFFLISFAEEQLRLCIDTFDEELPSLHENKEYSSLRKDYHDPDQFMFLSLENSRGFLKKSSFSFDLSGKDIVDKELAATLGFSGFSYGAWRKNEIITDKIMVLYESEKVSNGLGKQLKIPPSIPDTLHFSPQDPLVYYWTNTINFELLYQLYGDNVPENDAALVQFSKTLENLSGMTANEFFRLFGKEFSYILTTSSEDNFLSIPDGIILLKIENRELLEVTMEKLISSYGIPVKKTSYGQTLFYSWADSPQDGLQPLYGFLDDYLLIGNSLNLAKQLIDGSQNGINLSNDPQFLEIDAGLTDANNYISYTNNVELINMIKTFLTLASTVIAIENRETAARVGIITKNIIHPLLDGAAMLERTTTRGYFTENSVVIESTTKITE